MCCSPDDLFLEYGDFNGSPNTYTNKIMKGMRFRVLLDGDKQLKPGVEVDYLTNGGFQIIIPGYAITTDTTIIVQFY